MPSEAMICFPSGVHDASPGRCPPGFTRVIWVSSLPVELTVLAVASALVTRIDFPCAFVPYHSNRMRGSGSIDREDALTAAEVTAALAAGDRIAAEQIADGAQLLIAGDLGIGNTTVAAALIAASYGLPAAAVTGRGTGVDDATLAHKTAVIDAALARAGARAADPMERLAALGSADLAAGVGFLLGAARRGTPVLLDGLIALAEAVVAASIDSGVVAWLAAGHRSTEPGQSVALTRLGLKPLLDLGLRLGEGTGAVAAVPLLRSAVATLRNLAQLSDLS